MDVGEWRFTCSDCSTGSRSPNAIYVTVVQPPTATNLTLSTYYTNTGQLRATAEGVTAYGGATISRVQWYLYGPSGTVFADEQSSGAWYKDIDVSTLPEGEYSIGMVLYDSVGNVNNTTETGIGHKQFVYDKTAPNPGTISVSAEYTNQSSVTIYITGPSDALSGIRTVYFGGKYGTEYGPNFKGIDGTYDAANNRYYATYNFADVPNTLTGATNQGDGIYQFDAQAVDNAGNAWNVGPLSVTYDTTAPTLSVNTTSCSWRNSALSVTITAQDPDSNESNSGLSSSNSYQYFLSNSATALSGGSWTNYTSGTAINLNPGASGTYYLFVRRINDNAGNISTANGTEITIDGTTYYRYGAYQFDYDKPTWSYVSKDIYYSTANDVGNDDYANRERTVKITFKGQDVTSNVTSTLTKDAIAVSVNGTAVPNANKSLETIGTTTNTKEITYVLTITGITGDGTLNVVIPSGTLTDQATNTNVQTTLTTSINITIDNTNPSLTLAVTSPAAGYYKAGQTITITATYNENVYKEITSNNLIDTTAEAPAMALTFGGVAAKGAVTCSGVSGRVITYTYTIQGPTTTGGTDGDNGALVIKSLGKVYDAAGNGIETSNLTPSVSIVADTTIPTLTVNPTSVTWRNSALSVTVTNNDTGGSKIASNSGSYFLSTSTTPTAVATGEKLSGTYTSETAFSINPGTSGTYYLFVREIADNAGNVSSTGATDTVTINGVKYHRYGAYYFDYDKPIWSTQNFKINETSKFITVDLIATDDLTKGAVSGFANASLDKENITVYVDGVEAGNIQKTLSGPTSVTNGVKYTLTITGWGEQAEGQPYIDWNGIRSIEILENTIIDQAGNKNAKQQIILESPKEEYTPSFINRDETELNYTTDNEVDITYTLYKDKLSTTPYVTGDYRVISTTTQLLAGTKLTLKDYVKGKIYYYHVTAKTSYKVEDGKYIYKLADFIEMGSTDSKYQDTDSKYQGTETYYNGALEYVLEKYKLSIDFLDANISANKLAQETYLELRSSDGTVKYDNGETTIKYNLYHGQNAVMTENLSNEGQTYTVTGETEIPFTLNASLTEQQTSDGNKIMDTKYYDKIGGVAIEILNEHGIRLKDAQTFKIVNTDNSTEEHVSDKNGVIRIPVMEEPSTISKNYNLVIDPGTAPNGNYSINVHFFASNDGKHIGNEAKVSKQFNVTFKNKDNEQTLIKIDATNGSRVINQSTGLNLEGKKGIDMKITVGNPTSKTNVRAELYKRDSTFTNPDDESTYTGPSYTLVDLKQYLEDTWQTPEEVDSGLVSATDSKEYILLPRQTYESSVETTINLQNEIKDNVATGEYKLVIKSYDDNTLLETVSKTFVVLP